MEAYVNDINTQKNNYSINGIKRAFQTVIKCAKTKFLTLSIIFLLSINSVLGQENIQQEGFNKNAVYGGAGTLVLYFSATGYYERILNQKSKFSSLVKFGGGGYATWGAEGQYILAQYGILTGAKKHHLELGAGPYYYLNGDYEGLWPTVTIGWRVQKPGDNFIFRMGASFPEALYVSIGTSFN